MEQNTHGAKYTPRNVVEVPLESVGVSLESTASWLWFSCSHIHMFSCSPDTSTALNPVYNINYSNNNNVRSICYSLTPVRMKVNCISEFRYILLKVRALVWTASDIGHWWGPVRITNDIDYCYYHYYYPSIIIHTSWLILAWQYLIHYLGSSCFQFVFSVYNSDHSWYWYTWYWLTHVLHKHILTWLHYWS